MNEKMNRSPEERAALKGVELSDDMLDGDTYMNIGGTVMENIDKKDSLAGMAGQELADDALEHVSGGAGQQVWFNSWCEVGKKVTFKSPRRANLYAAVVKKREIKGNAVWCYLEFFSVVGALLPNDWYKQEDLCPFDDRSHEGDGGGSSGRAY